MGISIRPWQKGDLASLRTITWKSWISTYSSFIPESDIKSYFDIHYTDASLLSMFEDTFTQGFVAEVEDGIAGTIRLFFNRNENRLYIPSLHVLPGFQGQGIGTWLLEVAGSYATEKGFDRLWIGVMVKNRRALFLYRKVGFQFVREEPFTLGNTTVSHLIGYKKAGGNAFPNQKIYATFGGGEGEKCLSALCLDLLSQQKKTWQDLREGYELLKDVKERDVSCNGFSVRLQHNPGRIRSTLAEVSEKNVKERQCFLCLACLPEDQKGILYRNDYLILCNPMPVFSSHFTVSHLDHRHQAVAENIDTLLQLMVDFGSGWTVFYNGPRCGASAPDHLHFQAAPSGQIPIEKEIRDEKRLDLITQVGGVFFYRVRDLGRAVIVLKGDDPMAVGKAFKGFLGALKKVLLKDEEPMMNLAGFHEERKWRLMIFPRRRHRPDAFFTEGDGRLVVSPGVIDMGGVLVTPVEKDFDRLDGASVEALYGEVSLDGKTVERAFDTGMLEKD